MRNLKALPAQCEQLCQTTLLDQGAHRCVQTSYMRLHQLNPLPRSYRDVNQGRSYSNELLSLEQMMDQG